MSNEVPSTSDARVVNNTMRHQYRVLSDEEKTRMQRIKDMGAEFVSYLEQFPRDRESSLAIIKIEEAVMWAVKGITK